MARILLFGRDHDQLETRQWFLKKLYDSVPVCSVLELEAQAAQGTVDLLVLCETVSQEDACSAGRALLKRFPSAKVLAITNDLAAERAPGVLVKPCMFLEQVERQLNAA